MFPRSVSPRVQRRREKRLGALVYCHTLEDNPAMAKFYQGRINAIYIARDKERGYPIEHPTRFIQRPNKGETKS